MKKQVVILALMITLSLLLCACSPREKSADELFQEIALQYGETENFDINMSVTADYGDRVYQYSLKYTGTGEDGSLQIIQPENISGLTAKISGGEASLIFDGAEINTGSIAGLKLTPIGAIPEMVKCWQEASAAETSYETILDTDTLRASYSFSDNAVFITWFDVLTHFPVMSEIAVDGQTVITCKYENINMN